MSICLLYIVESTKDKDDCARFNVTTVTLATYGRRVKSVDDAYVHNAERLGKIAAGEGAPGGIIVDLVPACKYCQLHFYVLVSDYAFEKLDTFQCGCLVSARE